VAFDHLETESFWRDLAPDLAIHPVTSGPVPVLHPNKAALTRMLGIFDREGYIQLPRTQDVAHVGRLASLVDGLRAVGLPAVFAFVYEEMWQPFRRLGLIFDSRLGGKHVFMPDLWAWHVDPRNGEEGWTPHRDRLGDVLDSNQRPKSITAWYLSRRQRR
jgi:hypothetical protein